MPRRVRAIIAAHVKIALYACASALRVPVNSLAVLKPILTNLAESIYTERREAPRVLLAQKDIEEDDTDPYIKR